MYTDIRTALAKAESNARLVHPTADRLVYTYFLEADRLAGDDPLKQRYVEKEMRRIEALKHTFDTQRAAFCMARAMDYASSDEMHVKESMDRMLRNARRYKRHVGEELEPAYLDKVWRTFRENNPRRRKKALRHAWEYAKRNNRSTDDINHQLDFARKFSDTGLQRMATESLGAGMKAYHWFLHSGY